MNEEDILEELEFEIVMAQKAGHAELIPGLERAIKLINDR